MKRLLAFVAFFSLYVSAALGQPSPPPIILIGSPIVGTCTNTYVIFNNSGVVGCQAVGSGLTVGTTTITGGVSGRVLYDNAGVLGEYAITGTGNVVMSAAPTLTGNITLGTVIAGTWNGTKIGLAFGGTNVDLSGTGGTSQVLKQTSVGGNVTVAQLACADLSDAGACNNAGAALTRTNDTNVTLTLGGTPATALLQATSLTLGWSGQLGLSRGGTNANLSATGGTSQVLKQVTAGANITVAQLACADLSNAAATCSSAAWSGITGTPTTLSGYGITSPLNVAQGGTAAATLTAHAVLLGEGTSAVAFATIGTGGRLLIDQGSGADPAFTALSQDCTITSGGAITCTKTNNVAFATSATTDTTSATNITSGSLPVGRFSSAASHAALIDVAGTATWKVIPDCTDTGGNHLNYTQSTDAFSCGTSGSGGSGPFTTTSTTTPAQAAGQTYHTGLIAAPSLTTTGGQGAIFNTAAGGLNLQGFGSTNDVTINNKAGSAACVVPTNTQNLTCNNNITASNNITANNNLTVAGTITINTTGNGILHLPTTNSQITWAFANQSNGVSAATVFELGNDDNNFELQFIVNSTLNTGGNGAKSTTIQTKSSLFLQGVTNNALKVASTGAISLFNQPTTGTIAFAVCAAANADGSGGGALILDSNVTVCGLSAKAFKVPVSTIMPEQAALALDSLPIGAPVWKWNDTIAKDKGHEPHIGLYADDVEAMDRRCAIHDKGDSSLRNYEDRCIIALLVAARQRDQQQLQEQQLRIRALESLRVN